MTIQEEYRLSFYKKVANLNDRGHVYFVQHIETGQLFVKKELSQYSKEAYEKIKVLNSPYFPRIYELVEDAGTLLVIEEYIQGKNLSEYLKANGYLEEKEVLEIGIFLCEALAYVHGLPQPIVHRDIKPANIMTRDRGGYCLLDFNTAKVRTEEKSEDTVLLGTRDFAAPEQYGFGQSDERTDIYGIGVTLQYLLSGTFPKDGYIESSLKHVIQKATRLEPSERFASVSELRCELKSLLVTDEKHKQPVRLPGVKQGQEKKDTSHAGVDWRTFIQTRVPGWKYVLPGFRTLVPWKMFVSGLYYAVVVALMIDYMKTDAGDNRWNNLYATCCLISILMVPPLIWFNYLDLKHKWTFYRSENKWIRYGAEVVYPVLIVCGLIIIFATMASFFS